MIQAFVGFEKPVAKVNVGGGSTGNWWTAEAQINGVAGEDRTMGLKNVVTLLLNEDRVSPLRGCE